MPDAPNAHTDWIQVELMGHRSAAGQRVAGVLLALAGAVGVGLGFLMAPQWWAVVLMLLACGFVVLVGLSLWFQAGAAERGTIELRSTGRRVDLPVVAVTDTSHDMETFRLELGLPVSGGRVVLHECSDRGCIAAARAFPGSRVPAMIDESREAWGVLHGPIDR
ncbi:hypothetical protein OED01_08030 [Microbacterium sp. M28]|uniref:hypothetical protein n=1 Tax=Microbacterium sp. M28 TaxID=2962064 RepID=UPI0021F46D74|nr:hypothetical protein [Microbacterium sp. M28]UYO98637.1 hypothetical protein OED01_08030 [Microbacterium sp. M28]